MPLFIITIIGGILRFYNLMWGDGFFFHPDERNMAISITKLCFNLSSFLPTTYNLQPTTIPSCSMNPHFFAYGQFPTYLAYFSNLLVQLAGQILYLEPRTSPARQSWIRQLAETAGGNLEHSVSFRDGVLWLRFWSALASTLTIPIVYLITKELIKGVRKSTEKASGVTLPEWALTLREWDGAGKLSKPMSGFSKSEAITLRHNKTNRLSRASRVKHGMRVLPSLAALLTAFTPGLIQAAHFGTTESLLTFFFITIIYLSIKLINSKSQPPNYKQAPSTKLQTPSKDVLNLRFRICNLFGIWDLKFGIYIMALAIVSGLALGTKLSAIFFLPAPILAILLCRNTKHETRNTKQLTRNLLQVIGYMLLFFVFCFLFFVASSPYNFLAWSDFLGTSTYEAQVAQGKAPVFYTQQFEKTIPVWYQLTRIFPYALGPGLELLGILGLLFIIGRIVHKITRSRTTTYIANEAILLGSFVGYFLPNAFLYCKWTRFITPVMPFFAIFAAWLLSLFFQKLKKLRISNLVLHVTCYMLHALLILPGLLFFTIYLKPDIRAEASEWIYKNIPEDSYVLSETANVVDIPLGLQVTSYKLHDYKVISFNFYDLDSDESLQEKLVNHLLEADYLFVPSHRIFAHVLRLLEKYPLTARYYQLLFSGQLGFEKIAHFSRLPDEAAEETWSVFDHPAIRIYQKKKHFSKDELQRLLTI